MDWQNRDPAASGVTAALKAAQPRGAPGPVGKRLRQERMNRIMPGDKAISAFSESDNLFKWVGTMHGAAGTIHEDLRCKLSLEFPSGHPYNTPTVKFLTWPALYDVRTILLCVQSLLGEPSIHSPLNTQATELWENPTAFKKYLQETCSEQVSRSPVKNPDLHCPAFHLVLSFFFFPPLDGVFFICVCIGLCL
ncbi:ubiquitin-conjugating enzyme E2 C-like isoform X2 [Erinaceus europaeus]|uniref:Ubiquitin-conjugating enzyme E2 C-like isoform X2 n=1 Tax=Erinaceus europaeus TaxID=9365 RepID=A0ABM3XKN8_ERIEU|nr:ubiquitin-conjugating enzyme E2 C-like isoform X2 [Erinaceus europaeus]